MVMNLYSTVPFDISLLEDSYSQGMCVRVTPEDLTAVIGEIHVPRGLF